MVRLVLLLLIALAPQARAGVMTREALQGHFPAPLSVGEKDAQLPVWPIFRQELTSTVLAGYVFESIDFAPIPGFSGTPINLLVALDTKGQFLDVKVLSHHEPVFLDGLGPAPLFAFAGQYAGLSLRQNIKIGSNSNRGSQAGSANVYIDGVSKATASVRILNQSLLASALRVARAKLGFAAGADPDRVARVRQDTFRPMDWQALVAAGLVQRVRITRGTVEQAFAGSGVEEGVDAGRAQDSFSELYLAYLNDPAVGRNLLSEGGWQHLLGRIEEGDHALLVIATGAYSFVDDRFVRGAVPDRLTLQQGELPLELRDLDLDDPLKLPPALQGADSKVLRVIGPAGLDPARRLDFALRVTRQKGMLFGERVSRSFAVPYQLPADQVIVPESTDKGWQAIWRSRAWELAVLAAALALLAMVLARPRWIVATPARLARFRTAYLVFTLGFIGWWAQGQLSIVNLTATIQALVAGRSLDFLLYDPISVALWAFTAVTLLVWGRGTFCGWLCPFGALQELVAQAAQRLGLRRIRLHRSTDARLKRLKYVVLVLILALAFSSPVWTDRAVEVEPFKTVITLNFVRAWPFVAWAVGLLLLNAFVYKGFCRYLCPLGAGLNLLGRVRLLRWIPRRAECGTPCQTCRHRCDYQAIRPGGAIVYEECFQCLDCVAIHDSPQRCAPLIAQGRQRVIPLAPAA
ncbi:4Fe-4S binding protein [Roseateles saccharophilus]|uniref:Transcriptional regulator of nitric oxide reductase n=1 Tax=Roseateles saccharophilus TaxID=304 RepID=A0A4R3UJ07_ROSSA|nr:4Fe-4S binding protein [Roseateles saccharophilus]MDG0834734.1 4Fe-4S binding protein [Roseateles saccharophilus]TCU88994.1 transcriptional regulator of nitric oxide reductase [Roseateles saccharophilus]